MQGSQPKGLGDGNERTKKFVPRARNFASNLDKTRGGQQQGKVSLGYEIIKGKTGDGNGIGPY